MQGVRVIAVFDAQVLRTIVAAGCVFVTRALVAIRRQGVLGVGAGLAELKSMRERRSADRGIEGRRTTVPTCDVLPAEVLARYLTRSIGKSDRGAVEAHLQGCDECWNVLESTYKLLAAN